jgi:hypothetical protein
MSSLQQNWRKGQKMFCLKVRGGGREREEAGGRGKKWPHIVCTHEYVNKEKENKVQIDPKKVISH